MAFQADTFQNDAFQVAGGAEYSYTANVAIELAATASRLSEIVKTALVKIGLNMEAGVLIDIGSAAIERPNACVGGLTWVSKDNPANVDGVITSVEIYAYAGYPLEGCKIGVFYKTDTTSLKCRSATTIGDVAAGSKQTFDVSLSVQTGDYIGIYFIGGYLATTQITDGCWSCMSDHCIVGNEAGYSSADNILSLYGRTGASSSRLVELFRTGTTQIGLSATASRLTDIVRTGAVALGLMVMAEKFREVIALVKIGLRMGVGWAVDIGDGAINGNGFGDPGDTWINKGNPANAAGVITTVKIWAYINMTGCKVGIFYLTGTNKFKCRSAATIGSVTAGGERTFSGLSLAVEAGDYIGASASTGRIEASYDSYDGTWEKSGDYCVVDAEGTFTFWTGWKYSLYGEGASADVLCSRLVECFRIGTVNLGLATTAKRTVEILMTGVVAIGQAITASKVKELIRSGTVTIGLGVSALRSKLTERVADVAVGLSTTASRLVEITRTSAVTIGEAVTASITGVVSIVADVQIGMSVSSSRLVEVARTSSVAVGLAATASYCKFKEFIGSVAIGMSVSASRAVEIIRSPVVQVGLSVTASRTVEIFRTATVAIGEIATAIIKAGREIVAVVFIGMSVTASKVKELFRVGTTAIGLAVTASWLIPRIGRFLYVAITTSPYRKISITTSPYRLVRMVTALYKKIKVFTFRR